MGRRRFMNEYILFLDETLTTPQNPNFCLAGFAATRKEYEGKIIPEISRIKKQNSINHTTPLHYTDIKNSKNGYEHFKEDGNKRANLMNSIVSLISSLNITTFGVYFNQKIFSNLYKSKLYDIALFELLRNYTCFLIEHNSIGSICIESRSLNENAILQDAYYFYLKNGSIYYDSDDVSKYLKSISFSTKQDTCAGLELCDFMPVAFARNVMERKDNYGLFSAIKSKLYKSGTEYENVLGIRHLT